jgi:general stress protein YciG
MPNNNPAGHNQYTKRKEQLQQSAVHSPGDSSGGSPMSSAAPMSGDASSAMSAGNTAAPAKRGFAAMDEATQRGIASKGGQSQGKENNPGNFANDPDRAREAGRKGGEAHGTHR